MIEIQQELLDAYDNELSVALSSFEMMGRLLNVDYVKERVELLGTSEFYIYGGGYLGIQLYHITNKLVKVLAIVDKKGKLSVDIPEIPVIDTKIFKKSYRGQKVIVASIKFYCEIKKELSDFVPQSQIIYLGEFLGGILK